MVRQDATPIRLWNHDLTTRHRADTPATSMACTLLLLISNEHVTALWFDLIWLASYCITTRTRTLTLASYCCPTEAVSYCPTNPTSPVPIRIRTDKPRTVLPCELISLASLRLRNEPDNPSCRYAYEPDLLTSLVPICLRAEHD